MVGSGYRAVIDGRQAALINLSLSGAQLRGPIRVRPDQPTIVKIGWPRDNQLCTAIARVRWVQFEPDASSGEGLYRVGLAFETWDVKGLKAISDPQLSRSAEEEAPGGGRQDRRHPVVAAELADVGEHLLDHVGAIRRAETS